MSDIDISLDGLIAFIAAAGLSLLLLAGITGCLIYGPGKSRREGRPLRRQTVFQHIVGMLIGLGCFVIIMLLLFYTEWMARPHTLNRWLDNWVWLWAASLLSPWPLSAYVWKKRQSREPV